MSDDQRRRKGWNTFLVSRRVWLVLAIVVLAFEAFALLDEPVLGRNWLEPLSTVVIAMVNQHPRWFGGGLAALLGWLTYHFLTEQKS